VAHGFHVHEEQTLTNLVDPGPMRQRKRKVKREKASPTANILDLANRVLKTQRKNRNNLSSRAPHFVKTTMAPRDERFAAFSNVLARSANDYSPEITATACIPPYDAASAYVYGIDNPWLAPAGSLHVLDPNTTTPCESAKYTVVVNLAVTNGSTSCDGSLAFLLRGEPKAGLVQPLSISGGHVITWTGGPTTDLYTTATYSANYYVRPVVTFARVRIFKVGDPHAVSVMSYRIMPDSASNQIAYCPTAASLGVTTAQRTYMAGSETLMPDNALMDFKTHQSRGSVDYFTWSAPNTARNSSGFMATVVWMYGLRSTDRVEVEFGSHVEFCPVFLGSAAPVVLSSVQTCASATALTTAYADELTNHGGDQVVSEPGAGPESKPSPSAKKVASVVNKEKIKDTVDNGISAIEDIITGNWGGAIKNVYDGFHRWFSPHMLAPRFLTTLTGVVALPPLLGGDFYRTAMKIGTSSSLISQRSSSSATTRKTPDEEKTVPDLNDLPSNLSDVTRTVNALTDDPEIVTPKSARRPSVALSLGGRRK